MKHWILLALAACGAAPKPGAAVATLTKSPATVGTVVAVEEIGDTTVVLDEHRAFVLRGGALSAVAEAPHGWLAGAAVAAPDGEGRWAIGIDRDGRLWRITIAGELEEVSDRFALGHARVAAIAAASTTSAFALGDGLAVSNDGVHVERIAGAPPVSLIATRGRIAMLGGAGVDAWDLARGTMATYAVAGARAIAFVERPGTAPQLVVATDRLLYVEVGAALRRIAAPPRITALIAAGARLWLVADGLYALDGTSVRRASVALSPQMRVFGSPTGDAWLASPGELARATIDHAIDDPTWQAQVAPVFQRVCSHCHLPGGEAGIDLSTAAAWHAERDELARRVLLTRTMPPAGTDLGDADRHALEAWLGAK